jgi:hypothetical protein
MAASRITAEIWIKTLEHPTHWLSSGFCFRGIDTRSRILKIPIHWRSDRLAIQSAGAISNCLNSLPLPEFYAYEKPQLKAATIAILQTLFISKADQMGRLTELRQAIAYDSKPA